MKLVLDTNILCSALITPGGLPDRLYLAWRDGSFDLVTSHSQLEEFRRVTRYPRVRQFIEPAAAGSMHNELRHLAVFLGELPPVEEFEECRDPADNFLLAMAQASEAQFLVTGDKHDLLSMRTFGRTRIVTVRRMLGQLEREGRSAKARKRRGRPDEIRAPPPKRGYRRS